MHQPDYAQLREQTPFRWRITSTYLALLDITGIKIRDMFLHPEVGIELYRRGRPLLREAYGDLPVVLPGINTAPVSYGHDGLPSRGAAKLAPRWHGLHIRDSQKRQGGHDDAVRLRFPGRPFWG